ncbi:MAG TPA: glycosyltransferase family 2 protein [Candidatus Polarisedimenticolaceae bacterium]|nr:glycosyltransferase family 2 protein [Candidatus Polarisedimenticolaceae bacterium]
MATRRPAVSAIITTYNEERNIARCIESLLWCDELLVVDSHSTDRTPEIVRGYERAQLLQHTYYGAAAQKNWSIPRTRHEWLFILDADEACTPELRAEIEALLAAGPTADAYTIRRRVWFLGRPLRFSGWRHDRVVRLFRRGAGSYQPVRVHPKWLGAPAPPLASPMEHYMVEEFDPYVMRIAKYGWWGAAQAWRDGKSAGFLKVLVRTLHRFLRTYVLQLGVLDGTRGLVFCMLQAYGTYVKWSILWSWRLNERRGIPPRLPQFESAEEERAPAPGAEQHRAHDDQA